MGRCSGREDDNPETIKKRVDTFVKITTPLVQWFEKQGKVKKVNAGLGKDEVYACVTKILDASIENK
jgi:UMP-CMP kinase